MLLSSNNSEKTKYFNYRMTGDLWQDFGCISHNFYNFCACNRENLSFLVMITFKYCEIHQSFNMRMWQFLAVQSLNSWAFIVMSKKLKLGIVPNCMGVIIYIFFLAIQSYPLQCQDEQGSKTIKHTQKLTKFTRNNFRLRTSPRTRDAEALSRCVFKSFLRTKRLNENMSP